MAKKDEKSGVDAQLDRLREGRQIEAGYCLDFDRDPVIYECSEVEEAVARGDTSLSYDGTKALDLKSGQVEVRDVAPKRAATANFSVAELGGPVPAASSPTGGGGRGPVAGAGTRTTT
jgi:hypothetical protein